jgi:hypothetical protein
MSFAFLKGYFCPNALFGSGVIAETLFVPAFAYTNLNCPKLVNPHAAI